MLNFQKRVLLCFFIVSIMGLATHANFTSINFYIPSNYPLFSISNSIAANTTDMYSFISNSLTGTGDKKTSDDTIGAELLQKKNTDVIEGESLFTSRIQPEKGIALESTVIPEEYTLGPGDMLQINLWKKGNIPNNYSTIVLPEGKIYLPFLGEINASGITLKNFTNNLKKKSETSFPEFQMSVLLTGVRAFKVYVLGEVKNPGIYDVDALTRITQLITRSGGITPVGSIRSVELREKEKVKNIVDLFEFYRTGDNKYNPIIKNGQTIFIPIRYGTTTIEGEVYKPGKYEIKKGEPLKKLIEFAKGITPNGYAKKVEFYSEITSERNEKNFLLAFLDLDKILNGTAEDIQLKNNDRIKIYNYSYFKEATVSIAGEVKSPLTAVNLGDGMKLKDLLFMAGGITQNADLGNVWIERTNRNENIELIKVDLKNLLSQGTTELETANILLAPRDKVIVHSILTNAKKAIVEGQVNMPGTYNLREGEKLSDILLRAGGVLFTTKKTVSEKTGEIIEIEGPADLGNSYIVRKKNENILNSVNNSHTEYGISQKQGEIKIPLNLYKLLVQKDSTYDTLIEDGDKIVIPSTLVQVYINGEVLYPGAVGYIPNRTVRDYVGIAGITSKSDVAEVSIKHRNGVTEKGLNIIVEAGDTIFIPEKKINKWLGYFSVLGSVFTTLLAVRGL